MPEKQTKEARERKRQLGKARIEDILQDEARQIAKIEKGHINNSIPKVENPTK